MQQKMSALRRVVPRLKTRCALYRLLVYNIHARSVDPMTVYTAEPGYNDVGLRDTPFKTSLCGTN